MEDFKCRAPRDGQEDEVEAGGSKAQLTLQQGHVVKQALTSRHQVEEHGYQRLVPEMKSVQCDYHFVISGLVKGGQIFGTMKNSAFSTKAQSRFVSVVLDHVLGPSLLAGHT